MWEVKAARRRLHVAKPMCVTLANINFIIFLNHSQPFYVVPSLCKNRRYNLGLTQDVFLKADISKGLWNKNSSLNKICAMFKKLNLELAWVHHVSWGVAAGSSSLCFLCHLFSRFYFTLQDRWFIHSWHKFAMPLFPHLYIPKPFPYTL